MKNILEQRDAIGNNIFDEVIIKKHDLNITTEELSTNLNIDTSTLTDYFLGVTKNNFPLGLRILNYLEEKEEEMEEKDED